MGGRGRRGRRGARGIDPQKIVGGVGGGRAILKKLCVIPRPGRCALRVGLSPFERTYLTASGIPWVPHVSARLSVGVSSVVPHVPIEALRHNKSAPISRIDIGALFGNTTLL